MATIGEQLYSKGEAEGLLRGRREGERKTKESIRQAIEKLKRGYSSQVIAQETDLSPELIEYLRQELVESRA